jgi:hypothetical protein
MEAGGEGLESSRGPLQIVSADDEAANGDVKRKK